jgi:amino acid transporter
MAHSRSLERNAMGLTHSVVMGVAGTAPSFSIAASAAILIGETGPFAPAIILYCGLTMLGIAVAFGRLNRDDPNAGASFIWVSRIFGPTPGFLAGWCVLVTSVLFMASATIPAASATLLLVAPDLERNPFVVTLVALAWLLAVSAVTLRGTSVTARIQSSMIAIELGVLAVIGLASLLQLGPQAASQFDWSSFSLAGLDPDRFIGGALISLFLFWGWDISLNMAEETRNGHRASGLAAVLAMLVLIVVFTAFHGVALVALDSAHIASAGTNLLFAVADTILPRPWSLLAILVVMFSTIGALATTALGFSRTLFAKSRHGVLHARWQQLHPRWNTPHKATLLFAALGATLLLLSLAMEDVARVLKIGITAIGLQSAFYYGLTGFACAWLHRGGTRGSPLQFLLTVLWPAASATALWVAAVLLVVREFDGVTAAIGIGTILAGLVPMLHHRHRRRRDSK